MSKQSASQIQSSEAASTPGYGVAEGGRAANAQSIAGATVAGTHAAEARGHGGGVDKGGHAASAQSQASNTPMFPQSWSGKK